MRYLTPLILLALMGAGCSSEPETEGPEVLGMRTVKLPDGQKIGAEVERTSVDMQKGMMFRDSLARGRGMLFIHQTPGLYPYWMYQTRIPLDIMWMDSSHRIVEISPDTPRARPRQACARTMAATRPRNPFWSWAAARRAGWG